MRNENSFHWTKAADDILRRVVQGQGKSYAAAAEIIGISRNACAARGHRIGILASKGQKTRKFSNQPRADTNTKVSLAEMTAHRKAVIAKHGPEPDPLGHLVNTGDCQFIHGDKLFMWCGRPKQSGKSYCKWHQALCYVPFIPRKRKVPATGQLEAAEC